MTSASKLLLCLLALCGFCAASLPDVSAEPEQVASRYQVRERTSRFFQRSTASSARRS